MIWSKYIEFTINCTYFFLRIANRLSILRNGKVKNLWFRVIVDLVGESLYLAAVELDRRLHELDCYYLLNFEENNIEYTVLLLLLFIILFKQFE